MLIGITLFPKLAHSLAPVGDAGSLAERTNVDISELATMKIYQTPEGGYFFVDRNVIDTALREILKAKDTSETTVFIVLELMEEGAIRERLRSGGAA